MSASKKLELPSLKGKRVLITGGLGFIGSNLAHKCLELGAKVSVFDCLDPRSGGNLYNVESIKDKIEICFHDILNFDLVSSHVANKDIIFNCAASTSHPFSMREPWLDMDVNSRGVINLLEAIRRFNKNVALVHIGTSTQIGKLQYEPADEKHPEFPSDIYSANKGVSEKYVLVYANAYGIKGTVVRLSNTFGPRATIHSPEFTFNNFFAGLALQNKDITVFGKGDQKRNVIYVDDAVNALICASVNEKAYGEALFAVGDNHYSVGEVAELTSSHLGSGSVRFIDWPKGKKEVDVGDAIISNKKIKDLIGWFPEVSIEEGLKKTKDYYSSCMKEYIK